MNGPLVVIDTETTGFPGQSWACVIEIGAVAYDAKGRERAAFNSFIRPSVALDDRAAGALAVSGIEPEVLADAPTSEVVWAAFCAWSRCISAGTPVVTAYNVPFDKRMVESLPGWGALPWDPERCVLKAATKALGKCKLNVAAERLNVPVYAPLHRALSDARTAGAVHWALQAQGAML